MGTSQLQTDIREFLEQRFSPLIIHENVRPDWLINERGERLELDLFMPQIHVAVEVQGRQHFQFVEYFHDDHSDFENQVRRDKDKKDLCEKRGIYLLEIASRYELEDLALKINGYSAAANGLTIQRKRRKKQAEIYLRIALDDGRRDRRVKYAKKVIEFVQRHDIDLESLKPDTTWEEDVDEALILDTPRVRLIGINDFKGKECAGNLVDHTENRITVSVRSVSNKGRHTYYFDPDSGEQEPRKMLSRAWKVDLMQLSRSIKQFNENRRLCRICGYHDKSRMRRFVKQDKDGRFKCWECWNLERGCDVRNRNAPKRGQRE